MDDFHNTENGFDINNDICDETDEETAEKPQKCATARIRKSPGSSRKRLLSDHNFYFRKEMR